MAASSPGRICGVAVHRLNCGSRRFMRPRPAFGGVRLATPCDMATVLPVAPSIGMVLHSCGESNPDSARFCSGCGADLSQGPTCPKCGHVGAIGARFCHECGAKLAVAAASETEQTYDARLAALEENVESLRQRHAAHSPARRSFRSSRAGGEDGTGARWSGKARQHSACRNQTRRRARGTGREQRNGRSSSSRIRDSSTNSGSDPH